MERACALAGWSNRGLQHTKTFRGRKTKFPLSENVAPGLQREAALSHHNVAAMSVGILEATVQPLSLRELLPDPPAAATGQDGKVSHVLGAEAPDGIAPVRTVS